MARTTQSPSGPASIRSGPSRSAGFSASSPPSPAGRPGGRPPRGRRGRPAGRRRALRGLTAVTVGHNIGFPGSPGSVAVGGLPTMPLAAARVARLLDAGRLHLAAFDPLANPAWNTDTLTQPGSPHPVAGA